ncbi:hypothetical protein EG68_03758 [Paragonimus skrjabini miyazakii]|uniref:Uncharacterized protein n=1 Tax=Paragonimus skrjabini miyazakii TaxID=59628 RepID=A0A8S9Z089_9TREM|nr:hypothetical protein EG68_03758 [Paragonimus skrjabini miyazakii]
MTDVVEEPIDHTQDFRNLIACKTFATYSELTDAIKEFEFNTKTRFIVRSCRKRYPADQLVYDTMSFRCQHYDVKRRSTSLGFRRTRTRLMLFCPVRFSVRASEHGLVVSHYTMLHNHSLITDNADWRRISDQLKSVGNKKAYVSTCLKRLKDCMRRELVSTDSLRSPRRKKIQECTSSSYFLTTELVHHCVRNPLPTLLAKFRRFELGFEQREPERLISQLEALIKRFYAQQKSPSYVFRSGSKLAEAVRDVICAECLMLAYQDMYVCHLCAWRAHRKCSTRAGISDICPRCTIDSKLTYVKERIPLYHVDSMSLTQTESPQRPPHGYHRLDNTPWLRESNELHSRYKTPTSSADSIQTSSHCAQQSSVGKKPSICFNSMHFSQTVPCDSVRYSPVWKQGNSTFPPPSLHDVTNDGDTVTECSTLRRLLAVPQAITVSNVFRCFHGNYLPFQPNQSFVSDLSPLSESTLPACVNDSEDDCVMPACMKEATTKHSTVTRCESTLRSLLTSFPVTQPVDTVNCKNTETSPFSKQGDSISTLRSLLTTDRQICGKPSADRVIYVAHSSTSETNLQTTSSKVAIASQTQLQLENREAASFSILDVSRFAHESTTLQNQRSSVPVCDSVPQHSASCTSHDPSCGRFEVSESCVAAAVLKSLLA